MVLVKKRTASGPNLVVEFDEGRIDEIFAEIDQCHLPGAAVGIAIGGEPVYRKGFGLASMELPIVLTPSTRMRIWSISKHFTCLAYMLLCEEGRAAIDDPLGRYFPEFHPVTHGATMRQLMGHISGLRDVQYIKRQFSGNQRDVGMAELLSLYRGIDDVDFAPGTGFSYGNSAYLLLTAAIERITGQQLEEVLRQRIFQPVGMHDTLLRRFDTDFVPSSATLHMTDAAGGFDRSYARGEWAGDGGMVSTVDDMLRWLAHMDAPIVGNTTTWAAMKAPLRLRNGTSTAYGLGLMIGQYRGVETLHHNGGGLGGNSQMLKIPAARLDIEVIVNRHDVSGPDLANKIVDACVIGLDPVRGPASRAVATGTFLSPTTERVIQLLSSSTPAFPWAKDSRQIASIDGMDMPVESDNHGALRPGGQFELESQKAITLEGDREKPSAIQLSDFGNVDHLVRVEQPLKADLDVIAGRYLSDTTHTEATISDTDYGPRLSAVGRFGSAEFTLECLTDGIWRARSTNKAMPWGGILSFDRIGGGFRFSSFRVRGLPFRRAN